MECQEETKVANNYWSCVIEEIVVVVLLSPLWLCAEQELGVGNSWFKKNDVYKYTWLRMAEGRVVDKALMDYLLLPRRMPGRLLYVKVWRRWGIV